MIDSIWLNLLLKSFVVCVFVIYLLDLFTIRSRGIQTVIGGDKKKKTLGNLSHFYFLFKIVWR